MNKFADEDSDEDDDDAFMNQQLRQKPSQGQSSKVESNKVIFQPQQEDENVFITGGADTASPEQPASSKLSSKPVAKTQEEQEEDAR